jgi:site-specific DNA recombinase
VTTALAGAPAQQTALTNIRKPLSDTPVLRAAIYARVSTAGQAEQGYSLEAQLAECRAYAERFGASVVLEHQECGSGADWDLPALLDILERAKGSEFDVLICLATSRLARDSAKLAVVERQLKRAGVQVRYVQQVYEDSPSGRLNRNVMAAIDEFERENIALRFALGKSAKIARGLVMGVGLAPYGYRFIRRQVKDRFVTEGIEPDPATAPIVQRIFAEAAIRPLTPICARLNAEGIPTPGRSGRWSVATIRTMLANPIYVGRYCHGRRSWTKEAGKVRWRKRDEADVKSVAVTPLVSQAAFDAARAAMTERKTREKARLDPATDPYVLRGLLTCERCNGPLACFAAGSKVRYYTCLRIHPNRAAIQGVPVCGARAVNAAALDDLAWAMVLETLLDPGHLRAGLKEALKASEAAARRRERVTDLKTLIRQKQRDMERLVTDWLGAESGSVTADAIKAKVAQLEADIKLHQAAIDNLLAEPLPALSEDDVRALEVFASRIRKGAAKAGPFERREVCRLLRLRGRVTEDPENGAQLGRSRFRIEWQAILDLRNGEDRLHRYSMTKMPRGKNTS